jgi:hypothetical protein
LKNTTNCFFGRNVFSGVFHAVKNYVSILKRIGCLLFKRKRFYAPVIDENEGKKERVGYFSKKKKLFFIFSLPSIKKARTNGLKHIYTS